MIMEHPNLGASIAEHSTYRDIALFLTENIQNIPKPLGTMVPSCSFNPQVKSPWDT